MHSIEVPGGAADVMAALDAADAAVRGLNFDLLDSVVRLRVLERMETSRRRQIAVGHDVIAGLAKEDPAAIGGPVHKVVADWLRISCAEASRRLHDATQLSPRLTLTGQELPPELPATAVAWRDGALDGQHLRVIQGFVRDLPESVPVATADDAERFLAEQAKKLRPDQLQKAAHRYALSINPDGKFSDLDRARQRGFTWCGQRADGMSVGKLVASPELRANFDAWLSHFAAPGMCNPDDETPCVEGEPDDECARRDARTPSQRRHDALNALVRGQLGDPKLGQHNGLPVALIVSTTLQELTSGTGRAVTGGGTLLPMRDVIRMGRHAHHYLVVFDEHSSRPLYLGRSRRIASPDQRIVLYAHKRSDAAPSLRTGHLGEEVTTRSQRHPRYEGGTQRMASSSGSALWSSRKRWRPKSVMSQRYMPPPNIRLSWVTTPVLTSVTRTGTGISLPASRSFFSVPSGESASPTSRANVRM